MNFTCTRSHTHQTTEVTCVCVCENVREMRTECTPHTHTHTYKNTHALSRLLCCATLKLISFGLIWQLFTNSAHRGMVTWSVRLSLKANDRSRQGRERERERERERLELICCC